MVIMLDMITNWVRRSRRVDVEDAKTPEGDADTPEGDASPPKVHQGGILGWYWVCEQTNARATIERGSKMLQVLRMGSRVNVVDIDGENVRIDNPVDGWCSLKSYGWDACELLSPCELTKQPIETDAWYRIVGSGGANVRSGKEMDSDKVRVLPKGVRVFVVQQEENRVQISKPIWGWCSIKASNGKGHTLLEAVETDEWNAAKRKKQPTQEMFVVRHISCLLSQSSFLYHYEDLFLDVMDFAFYRFNLYNINTEDRMTLVASGTNTPDDILKFLKAEANMKYRNARLFVPSRWVHHESYFIFSDEHDMKALVEASIDLDFWWHKELYQLQCSQEDHFEISFETGWVESDDFPVKQGTEFNVGMTIAGYRRCTRRRRQYDRWCHGQILSVVSGAEGLRRSKSTLDRDDEFTSKFWYKRNIELNEEYFYVRWFKGFGGAENEWMSSKRVYEQNELKSIREGIKHKTSYKWHPHIEKKVHKEPSWRWNNHYSYTSIHEREDGRESAMGV